MSNATPETDRWLASMREIVRQELARRLLGEYDYVVASANGTTIDATPADPQDTGAPNISGLSVWMGVPGGSCQPAEGSHITVVFLDGNRTKPRVRGYDGTLGVSVTIADATVNLGPTPARQGVVLNEELLTLLGLLDTALQALQALTVTMTAPTGTVVSSDVGGAFTLLTAAITTAVEAFTNGLAQPIASTTVQASP
jgi:hypothetical protein